MASGDGLKSSSQLNGFKDGMIVKKDASSQYANVGAELMANLAKAVSELENMSLSQIDTVKTINSLNLKNAKDVAKLQRKEQNALLEEYARAREAVLNKEEQDLHERHQQEIQAASAEDQAALENKYKKEEALMKKRHKLELKYLNAKSKEELALEKRLRKQKANADAASGMSDAFGKGKTVGERLSGLKKAVSNDDGPTSAYTGLWNGLKAITNSLGNYMKQLDSNIDSIANKKSTIDTRLQGLNRETTGSSYWDNISKNITSVAAISPYVKQKDIASQVESMVQQGIAFNIEQRATIEAIKDKIAGTFSATNTTLKRLVRIQEQDTTAARLGMESALTSFLNNMYETTEYMGSIADGIKSSLEESMSLMSGENALSFEYQVQKWLGSMYSTGMRQESVSSIGSVLGQIAAGQLEGITNGTSGNLAIMAANRAGLSISELMTKGLDDSDTNKLMSSMVDYLAEIYSETKGNNVLQQQYAQIYGLTASDLKAVASLARSTQTVASSSLSYNGALSKLNSMANTMYKRTSIGEMMSNALDNATYTMAASVANSPAAYMTYKLANMLTDLTGGIDFSIPLVMGSGSAQTFNVANLMRVGAMSASVGKAISSMMQAGTNGGATGSGILSALQIGSGKATVSRGSGDSSVNLSSGASTSMSGEYVANGSVSDISSSTMASQADSTNSATASAANESDSVSLGDVRQNVVEIYELMNTFFKEVTTGFKAVRVTVQNEDIAPVPVIIKS